MSTTQVQWRRGSGSTINTFIGASGEIVVNTDTNQIVVQDNLTAGGWTGARIIDLNNMSGKITSGINITNVANVVYQTGNQTISGTKVFNSAINDTSNFQTIDLNNRILSDSTSSLSIDYNNRYLVEPISNPKASLDWGNRRLNNLAGNVSIDWATGTMLDTSAALSISYQSRILSGSWYIQSGLFTQAIALSPALNSSSITLSRSPFYINNSTSNVTWTLPLISSCTGKVYQIKNRGAQVTLTGSSNDLFFAQYPVISFTVNSGEAYQLANDGTYWNIM
jgi:hypothetical protein